MVFYAFNIHTLEIQCIKFFRFFRRSPPRGAWLHWTWQCRRSSPGACRPSSWVSSGGDSSTSCADPKRTSSVACSLCPSSASRWLFRRINWTVASPRPLVGAFLVSSRGWLRLVKHPLNFCCCLSAKNSLGFDITDGFWVKSYCFRTIWREKWVKFWTIYCLWNRSEAIFDNMCMT